MMDWTDRHCRYFHRLITRRTRLYTEMVTTGALLHGDVPRHLDFNREEHPLALQLGGSEPADLAQCAKLAQQWGFDEVNLNCGCPSERVQRGAFGACLMAEAALVGDCVDAMRRACTLPVTVKHRTGIDHTESYDFVRDFVGTVHRRGGCTVFIVHARNAWLRGLSPKENREVPPLRYDMVYQLKTDFPDLTIVLNGGVNDNDQIEQHLQHVDGVMVGRQAYHQPWLMADWDSRYFNDAAAPLSRDAVEAQMVDYLEQVAVQGRGFSHASRHLMGLRHGESGARRWRQVWSDPALRGDSPRQASLRAQAAQRAQQSASVPRLQTEAVEPQAQPAG